MYAPKRFSNKDVDRPDLGESPGRVSAPASLRRIMICSVLFALGFGLGCTSFPVRVPEFVSEPPLTASRALAQGDAARRASLRLVIEGLDEDEGGRPSRASAKYQQAIQVDSTNPFAYLALARHHAEYGAPHKASGFLDQARSLFEAGGQLGPAVDVWGIGLRAWLDRATGRDASADARFDAARALSETIWADELLSASELR